MCSKDLDGMSAFCVTLQKEIYSCYNYSPHLIMRFQTVRARYQISMIDGQCVCVCVCYLLKCAEAPTPG